MRNRTFLLTYLLLAALTSPGQEWNRQQADSMINLLKTNKQGLERIDVLLTLAQFHLFKPGQEQVDIDSAKRYMAEAAALNKSLNSPDAQGYQVLTEAYLLREKGQDTEGKKMTEKAISILETTTHKQYLGRAVYELSRYYGYEDPKERLPRIKLVERAVNLYAQDGTLNKNAYSLEMLADLYQINQEYTKAIETLKRTLDAYNSIGHYKLQGVYVLLGQCYKYLRDYPQSLLYNLKALKTAQALGDTSMQMCQINNNLGVLYNEIGNKEMSAKYLSDGIEVARRHNEEDAIYWLSVNIANIYNELNQSEKAAKALDLIPENVRKSSHQFTKAMIACAWLKTYTGLRQFDKARVYCDTLLGYIDNNKLSDVQKVVALNICAGYFVATKQFQKARYRLTQNIEMHKKFPFGLSTLYDARLWFKLDSAQGNFKSALKHLQFYESNMDSIYALNKVRQLQALGVEYETELKEDSIKAKNSEIKFLTQANNLQSANLQQAGLIKNITIVGIILVLIIMGLLYRHYLHKQKNNKLVTQKNEQLQQIVEEKEWLLKEIHHRVKNNLQIIMSLLDSQSVYIDDEAALTAINDSQRRFQAISLIHQKLYQSENTSTIDMPQYIDELVCYLRDSFDSGSRAVFEQDTEPVKLDVVKAIPLGLIINEGIVNAIKYAFPGGKQGIVRTSLKHDGPDHLLLNISDNGVGLPSSVEVSRRDSLGFSLMQGLARQLDGSFRVETNKGLHISVRFSALNNHANE